MSRLFLAFIRHGEYQQQKQTPSASQPFPLSEKGMRQAASCAQRLLQFSEQKNLSIHPVFFCSTLLRAWQTASIITEQFTEPKYISETSELNERAIGSLANLTLEQINSLLEQDPRYERPNYDWKADPYYRLPYDGAESLMQSGERVAQFIRKTLTEIKQTKPEDTLVVMVGHGGSFRHAAYHLKLLEFHEVTHYSMTHATPLFFEWTPCQKQQGNCLVKIQGEWLKRPEINTAWVD